MRVSAGQPSAIRPTDTRPAMSFTGHPLIICRHRLRAAVVEPRAVSNESTARFCRDSVACSTWIMAYLRRVNRYRWGILRRHDAAIAIIRISSLHERNTRFKDFCFNARTCPCRCVNRILICPRLVQHVGMKHCKWTPYLTSCMDYWHSIAQRQDVELKIKSVKFILLRACPIICTALRLIWPIW